MCWRNDPVMRYFQLRIVGLLNFENIETYNLQIVGFWKNSTKNSEKCFEKLEKNTENPEKYCQKILEKGSENQQ